MQKFLLLCCFLGFSTVVQSATEGQLSEGMVNPGFYEKPEWFKDSFLELSDELEDANTNKRQVILYFHQDGCPYCKKLLDDNFTDKKIVKTMQQHFNLIEINMWGDKTVTLLSGEELSEKEFAKQMNIMFTPTLVILDNKGQSQFRMNGYYAPDKFQAALDYVLLKSAEPAADIVTFNAFYKQQKTQQSKPKTVSKIKTEKFIYKGNDLSAFIKQSKKPVMILFEQVNCDACNELHGDIFRRMPVYKQLKQYNIAQIDINSETKIISPDGQPLSERQLAKALNIQYTPSILFFEPGNTTPVFRSEAYLKNFHVQALFDYILSNAYKTEPEFQRFVQQRADKMRAQGLEVDLWK